MGSPPRSAGPPPSAGRFLVGVHSHFGCLRRPDFPSLSPSRHDARRVRVGWPRAGRALNWPPRRPVHMVPSYHTSPNSTLRLFPVRPPSVTLKPVLPLLATNYSSQVLLAERHLSNPARTCRSLHQSQQTYCLNFCAREPQPGALAGVGSQRGGRTCFTGQLLAAAGPRVVISQEQGTV